MTSFNKILILKKKKEKKFKNKTDNSFRLNLILKETLPAFMTLKYVFTTIGANARIGWYRCTASWTL